VRSQCIFSPQQSHGGTCPLAWSMFSQDTVIRTALLRVPRIIPALQLLIVVLPANDFRVCEATRSGRDSETLREYAASPGTTRVSPRSRGYSSQCLEVSPASLVCRRLRGVPFDRDVAALRHQVDARCPDFAVNNLHLCLCEYTALLKRSFFHLGGSIANPPGRSKSAGLL